MKRTAAIAVVLGIALASQGAPEYSAIFMNDAKIGHSQLDRTVGDGRVTTVEKVDIALGRAGAVVQVMIDTRYEETADGKPLGFTHAIQMGPLGTMSKRGEIANGRMRVTASAMGTPQEMTVDYPIGALMPEGVRLLTQRQLAKRATRYSYAMFDPEGLGGNPTEVVVGERVAVPLIGRVAQLTAVDVTMVSGGTPVRTQAYMDDAGEVRKASMTMMGMRLDIVACERGFAQSPNEQVDLLDGGSVASPSPILRPRDTRQATFTLVPTAPGIKLLVPDTQEQIVTTHDDGTVTVRVSVTDKADGTRPYRGSSAEAAEMLKPTSYVQSEHPQVVERARMIVGDMTDAAAVGRKIEAWVRNHITKKTLTVGYATALATLTGKAGDCTEHAVLTAALCRAAGIPCRVVVGVAYTERLGQWERRFVGHAWNQAFVGGKWVCLDASLGTDASRIALTIGAGDPLDFVAIIHSLGNFKITRVQTK